MNLTDMERKLLMLAMDKAATEDEMTVAAKKLIESFRKRFADGPELLKTLGSGLPEAKPGERVYKTKAEAAAAAAAMSRGFGPSYTRPFGAPDDFSAWEDIMREAHRFGQAREAAEAAQRQETWEEYCRRAAQQAQASPAQEPRRSAVEEEILRHEEEQRQKAREQNVMERIRNLFGTK